MKTKYLLLAALGIGAALFLTSDKGKELTEDLADKAKDKAKKWKERLSKLKEETTDKMEDLREMLSEEAEGLSDGARTRIEEIIDGSTKATGKAKKAIGKQLA